MEYRCRIGSLGNSSTGSLSNDRGDRKPEPLLGRRGINFFCPRYLLPFSFFSARLLRVYLSMSSTLSIALLNDLPFSFSENAVGSGSGVGRRVSDSAAGSLTQQRTL